MKQKNLITKMLGFVLTLVMLVTMSGNTAQAYTITVKGATTIEPGKADFTNAKSPVYCLQTQSIKGKISTAYKMDIYHYEAQSGGYYNIYTTGSLDTVGAVYEEQGLSTIKYRRDGYNDDGYIDADRKNFSIVMDLD